MLSKIIMRHIKALFLVLILGTSYFLFSECKECVEVAKGKIPAEYLDKSLKVLPSGIAIWDVDEAFKALNDKTIKILWVDTRPESFFKQGTIKGAVLLTCDLKGNPIPGSDKKFEITEAKLNKEIEKVAPNNAQVKVVFFCQGPKCHRSYNAALRAVADYGLDSKDIVWFRDGYLGLEKFIKSNPKHNKRIAKYLKGAVLAD